MPYVHGPVVPDYSGLSAIQFVGILAFMVGVVVALLAISRRGKRPGPPKLHR
jgi:hypothetical protein